MQDPSSNIFYPIIREHNIVVGEKCWGQEAFQLRIMTNHFKFYCDTCLLFGGDSHSSIRKLSNKVSEIAYPKYINSDNNSFAYAGWSTHFRFDSIIWRTNALDQQVVFFFFSQGGSAFSSRIFRKKADTNEREPLM